MASGSRFRRIALRALLALAVVAVVLLVVARVSSRAVPVGEAGPAADLLAHEIERAARIDAWNATGAVRWTFFGKHHHLWDKRGNRDYVRWGDHEAVVDLGTQRGCARVNGREVTGSERDRLVKKAYAFWTNDAFWLNPLGKLFDPGVVRKVVREPDGRGALLITFTLNGLTPGDSYLWLLDEQKLPRAWQMWTFIPIGGLEISWQGWHTLGSGALISTHHSLLGLSADLTDVVSAERPEQLSADGKSPFAWCTSF